MKKVEFIRLEDTIKQILIDNPKTRDDDMYLYYVYCSYIAPELPVSIIFALPERRKEYNITTFAAVERARRKIQAENPELASERMKKLRAKEEEAYKEYARI